MFERDLDHDNEGRRERLRFWLTVGLGAVLTGVVGALIMLMSRANDNYDRSLSWQAHSLEVISQTRSLDAALARAEAALGRFAVGLKKEDGRVFQQQWGLSQQYLALLRIDRLLTELIGNERAILANRNQLAAADRASLNQAILLFTVLAAAAAVIAIAATVSLVRAQSERRAARREQLAESDRAMLLEAAVNERTAELAEANSALRSEMAERAAAATVSR